MIVMAVPLCILFIISAYAVKVTQDRKKKRLRVVEGEGRDEVDVDEDAVE
jgi:Sec-independent protein secretion pathway component TatC